MTTFILVCPANSQWAEEAKHHPEPLFCWRLSSWPLSKQGYKQSRLLSAPLTAAGVKPDAIYSSGATQARCTAAPFAKACNLKVQVVGNLKEISWGDWEGQPQSLLETFAAARAQQGFDFRPPGGESYNQVRRRIMDALRRIARQRHDCVVCVMHEYGIKNGIRHAMGWETPEEQDAAVLNACSVTTVRLITPYKLEMINFNQTLI